MKRYKLKKDLPTFKAGQECWLGPDGELRTHTIEDGINTVYSAGIMRKFPNILTDWFEEIPETPKTVWDLKEGDGCFYSVSDGEIFSDRWEGAGLDYNRRDIGNIFITREEAEKELARRRVKVILEHDAKGFKPDWKNDNQFKFFVAWSHCMNSFDVGLYSIVQTEQIFFATREDAVESIREHTREWLIYLGIEE